MWSSSSSRPPGTRTRFILPIAAAGSGIVHSDSAQTTVSNDASSQGQVLGVALLQAGVTAEAGGALAGDGEHRRAQLDPGDVRVGRVVGPASAEPTVIDQVDHLRAPVRRG